MKRHKLTLNLTAEEALIVCGLLDGCADAGQTQSPEGLSARETEAVHRVEGPLLNFYHKHKEGGDA